ncbi:GH25 family lysozyme [Arthrobacter sp. CDRTa11]|uniref:GH25 family lysozyme n=1 Tax=Arthrobacter sp. CDRTa11 TaxID=2651199 RepID=UPI003A5CADAA
MSTPTKESMAEAVGQGGAEMGQRSARVTASDPSGSSRKLTTESLATEGTWMPTFGVQGLDVSGHQPSVDWQQQWNMGARFAYVKATEGSYFTNDYFNSQYQGSRNVGMIRGAYHFAIPNGSSASDQARFFVQNGGGWSADGYTMPPVLDFEFNPYAGRTINGFYFGNTCYDMSPTQLASWVREFGSTMLSMTGRLPVIYTNTNWWKECLGDPPGFGDYPLWVAAYPAAPTNNAGAIPSSWSTYSIWQYSSTGPFAGDSNVWNGSMAQLREFAAISDSWPSGPSIKSDADVLAADASGNLLNYVSNGAGGLRAPRTIGTGWTNLRSATTTDWDGDGVRDIFSQWNNGDLLVYRGLPAGGFSSPIRVGQGFQENVITLGIWRIADARPGVMARRPTGELLYYPRSGDGLQAGLVAGTGWGNINITMLDFDGDGKQDILAQTGAGEMKLYRSNGAGAFIAESRAVVGTGWKAITAVSLSSGFTGNGSRGLVVRRDGGALQYFPFGQGSWGQASNIGSGWDPLLILGSGDQTGPLPWATPADTMGITPEGKLLLYPADGGTLLSGRTAGTGWTNVQAIFSTDWDMDGKLDLLAQWKNGSVTLYKGSAGGGYSAPVGLATGFQDKTLTVGPWNSRDQRPAIVAKSGNGDLLLYARGSADALKAAVPIGWGWSGLDITMFDFDGDGNQDLIARNSNGQLLLYRTDGASNFLNENRRQVGSGWDAVDAATSTLGFQGGGTAGLTVRFKDGTLAYYPVVSGAWRSPVTIGVGWTPLTIAGSARWP